MTQNTVEQIRQLNKIATQGNSDAQFKLGLCYFYGDGVEKDFVQAFNWF